MSFDSISLHRIPAHESFRCCRCTIYGTAIFYEADQSLACSNLRWWPCCVNTLNLHIYAPAAKSTHWNSIFSWECLKKKKKKGYLHSHSKASGKKTKPIKANSINVIQQSAALSWRAHQHLASLSDYVFNQRPHRILSHGCMHDGTSLHVCTHLPPWTNTDADAALAEVGPMSGRPQSVL